MLFQHKHLLTKQRGVVIVIALFITALVAAMAYVMMARLARDTERVKLIIRDVQAESLAQGSIAWAMDVLQQNMLHKKADQLVDRLPLNSPIDHVQGFTIKSTIEDAQARFNLNNLVDQVWQESFLNLIRAIYPAFSPAQFKPFIAAMMHWMMSGKDNELDEYYAKLPMPYRAAHRLFFTTSGLNLVKGMTPALYRALQPYIIALPQATQINVATASAPLFVALAPNMPLEVARAIVQKRSQLPNFNLDTFMGMDLLKNHPIKRDKITILSQYFLVVTEISIENQRLVLYTLLQRLLENGKPRVIVLWQSKSIW